MKIHSPYLALLLMLTLFLYACSPQSNTSQPSHSERQEFDLVILNGRVIDPETNFDGIRNVGIKDGSIAVITEAEISGKETIDATGKVVSPGFIDISMRMGKTLAITACRPCKA